MPLLRPSFTLQHQIDRVNSKQLGSHSRPLGSKNWSVAASQEPAAVFPDLTFITPSSQPHPLFSAAASTTVSQPGGGGSSSGGGTSRAPPYPSSPAPSNTNTPLSPTFNGAGHTASNSLGGNNAGQLSKIVVAQIYLLLSTIKEDKDRTKWDSQQEQIRKLIDNHGEEVYQKFFRRLVMGNSPQIFPGINKPVENPGNYPILVAEVRKITQDPDQARKIAEAVDTRDGDLFRDFDLSSFMDHFKLDPTEKTILALAFKSATRPDLRTKADAILANNYRRFLELFSSPAAENDGHTNLPATIVTKIIEGLVQYPPRNLSEEDRSRLPQMMRLHYENTNTEIPVDVSNALQLVDLLGPQQTLAKELLRTGPPSTASLPACRATLQSVVGTGTPDEQLVAAALLFMVMTQNWRLYTPLLLVMAIRERGQVDWQKVVRTFDREGLRIDSDRFLTLYEALLPIATDDSRFDIQLLWGGKWRYPDTQLSFVTSFAAIPPEQLDTGKIPRLRSAFTTADFADASDEVKDLAARAVTRPLVSLDAIIAIFDLLLKGSGFLMTTAGQRAFQEIVQTNADVFLCASMAVPRPWTDTQQEVVTGLFFPFLFKQHPNYDLVLHCMWKHEKHWVAKRLVEAHAQDPMKLPLLLDHAETHNWLDDLLMILNGFGVDLAASAHRRGIVDLEKWAQTNAPQRGSQELIFIISRFLQIKAEDELKTIKKEQSTPRTISLAVKTVNVMLELLEDYGSDDRGDSMVNLQRMCIQAYPRLINYGEGFDDIIEANGNASNAIPEAIEKRMSEHYESMYAGERDVREIVEALQRYKNSPDPAQQDLFACMIHGLFDEYSCYQDYPLEALATTAVLFGGIINFNLISGLTLRVGLGMVLEAVREHGLESPMYKFGLQALLHFFDRLHEWPGFCSLLLQIPSLQGTEAYVKAEEVVRQSAGQSSHQAGSMEFTNQNGVPEAAALTNGNHPEPNAAGSTAPPFACIHADPPESPEHSEGPSEDVQDRVLFALNNLSEHNLESKIRDLTDALQERDYRWFAGYLVAERAKMQPNFHKLYLDMLGHLDNKRLWDQVLRETYVGVVRMLNAQATLDSSTERAHLKNLGGWLGSLTLARNRPIKFKNISFVDLLIEAYETQRLIIVIPFSCKVLALANKSIVFKPPNPWLMEIIGLLIELYHFAELRLQLKFEIEVLCKELSLDHRNIEPSTTLRERPRLEEETSAAPLSDTLDGFDDLSLAGLGGRSTARNGRFSPGTIIATLPDVAPLLVYPPTSNTNISRDTLRYVVETAVRRAIQEIISPVVERSVTIAAISTAQLIHKDFAMERDEDRVRQCALTMVKALAGSLALVTCKEPLRMSMTNYIRVISAEVEEQALPEGAILMCVNDNLDVACSLVENVAEQRAMPEIEENIEQQLAARRRHRAERGSEPFIDNVVSRWSFYIPDPYKLSPGGLNKEQLAIYEEFARQGRGPPSHGKVPSTDSGANTITDVDPSLLAVPTLSTPSEPSVLPYETPQPQFQRVQPPPPMPAQISETPQMNGFSQTKNPVEQIEDYVSDLQRRAREAVEDHQTELLPGNSLLNAHQQILRFIAMSPQRDHAALATAKRIFFGLAQSELDLEIEVLVHLLKDLCDMVALTAKEVTLWLAKQDERPVFRPQVAVALLEAGLLDLHRVDMTISRALQQRDAAALDFLSDLMDRILLTDRPMALRADFAHSLEALGQWLAVVETSLPTAETILAKLRERGMPGISNTPPDQRGLVRRDQIEYAFTEWTRLCNRSSATEKTLTAFLTQLHHQQLMNNEDEACTFFRVCIDMAVETFEEGEEDITFHEGDLFLQIDALAKLVIFLIRFQGQGDAEVKGNKPAYLNSILSLVVLVLNHHHVTRGDKFNQRVFFRFFSSLLCEYHLVHREFLGEDKEMMLVLSNTFLALQPSYFPAFAFGWLSLISHRYYMPAMLLMADQAGWEPFAQITEAMFSYVGDLLKPLFISNATKDFYRGVLRILLVLHHDLPEYLAENHYRLCGVIPAHCTQLRNLVLSAYPSSFPELPDPFTAGLKVDRINEIRSSPTVAGDYEGPINQSNIKHLIDAALDGVQPQENVSKVAEVISNPIKPRTGLECVPIEVDIELVNALVLYVGTRAIAVVNQKGGPTFVPESPEATFLGLLARKLNAEARYYFFSAIANHLRYPNTHTHYFSYALLFLFGNEQNEPQDAEIKQLITRVLLERLIVHRPHPWGLIITLLELLKNSIYSFWDLPFIKAAPEVRGLLLSQTGVA
ncbi:MAG: hypothetical protein M1816_001550 [Peltula sp. TS41687]|nr:MAG: hypothetical protein M1816_001550 [Peltula sp. TS41687]